VKDIKYIVNYILDRKQKIVKYILPGIGGILCLIIFFQWLKTSSNVFLIAKFVSFRTLFFASSVIWFSTLLIIFVLTEKGKSPRLKFCFYYCMVFSIICIIIASYISHGEAIRSILFVEKNDVFMDYFNSIQYGRFPYSHQVIYPPLINVLYSFFGHFNVINGNTVANRISQTGILTFSVYCFVVYLALTWIIFQSKGGSNKEKYLFIFVLFFSLPFIYAFERGNSIVLALFFILVYLHFYHSPNYKIKYLSFLALAIAASIKISPAIFGVLLIKERRFKDAIICAVIGLFVFLLPFLLTDGNIFVLLDNIAKTTKEFQGTFIDGTGKFWIVGQGNYVNILNTAKFLGRIFNVALINIAAIGSVGLLLFGILCVMVGQNLEQWKALGILSSIIVLCAGFSAIYNLIYLGIPLLYFIDKKSNDTKADFIYAFLFIGIFVPIVNLKLQLFKVFFNDLYPMKISTFVESIALLIFATMLIAEAYWNIYKDDQILSAKKKKMYYCTSLILVVVLMIYVYGYKAKQPIEAFYPSNVEACNVTTGFIMEDGLLTRILPEASVNLKTKGLLKYGLSVSYKSLSKNSSLTDNVNLAIIANDKIIRNINMRQDNRGLIFIDPITLLSKGVLDEKNVILKLKILNNDNASKKNDVSGLNINYIGPAQFVDSITNNTYFLNASSGFFKNGSTIWMGDKASILLGSNELKFKTLKISGFVPQNWYLSNPGKKPIITFITPRDVIVKELPNLGEFNIQIPYNKMCTYANYFQDYPILLKMEINGTFNTKQLEIDSDAREKSIIINNIVPVCLTDEFKLGFNDINVGQDVYIEQNEAWIGKNGDFIFDPTLFRDGGIYMAFVVPKMLYIANAGKPLNLSVYINEQKAREVKIKDAEKYEDQLQGLFISSKNLSNVTLGNKIKLHIELNSTFNPKTLRINLHDNRELGIRLVYIGSRPFIKKIAKGSNLDYYTNGFFYDSREGVLAMGTQARALLSKRDYSNNGMKIKYYINPLLLSSNVNNDLTLNVMLNEIKVKTVPIVEPGECEIKLSRQELQNVNNDYDFLNLKLYVNGVYNEKKLQIRNYDVDMSIKNIVIEPCNS